MDPALFNAAYICPYKVSNNIGLQWGPPVVCISLSEFYVQFGQEIPEDLNLAWRAI